MQQRKRSHESGNAIMELAIVLPFIAVTFFGTVGLGIMIGRFVQVVHVARDVAHMYSDGIDFTLTVPRNIVTQKLALGAGMTNTGGNGVLILSKISTVYLADCTAAGLTAGECVNQGLPVFTNRVYIGNTALRASSFGTPAAGILDAAGNISSAVYMKNTNSTVRTSGFEAILDDAVQRATGAAVTPPAQQRGEVVYLVEGFFEYPDIGFLGWSTAGGAYSRYFYR